MYLRNSRQVNLPELLESELRKLLTVYEIVLPPGKVIQLKSNLKQIAMQILNELRSKGRFSGPYTEIVIDGNVIKYYKKYFNSVQVGIVHSDFELANLLAIAYIERILRDGN